MFQFTMSKAKLQLWNYRREI